MRFDYIDGVRLKQAIIAGARRVIMMQDNLNRINVFPVPDNDTGTNMALTLQSVAEGAISCRDRSLAKMSQCLADSALMGARGNSGAILAQFFQGLAESFKGKVTASSKHFVEAAELARQRAYEAITDPKEGTILSVIHDWAEQIKTHSHNSHDFLELMRNGLHAAERSLKETPKKLKLLSKAGVVDAGAQGFVHMLEGIYHFVESGKIEKGVGIGGKLVARAKVKDAPEDITYQYCTECLIEDSAIDRIQLREELAERGDSLIVAGSNEKVRVHIHTDEPERVFESAAKYGQVSNRKADDMRAQHHQAYGKDSKDVSIALVTDTSCDLPSEFVIRHNIQMVPVQISFGNDKYLDKITITPKEFYRILQENEHYPKTSQPTPGDYVTTYKELWAHYKQAISIHLAGALSGTLRAAQTGARTAADRKIRVIDSCNTSVGLGLIVAEAAKAIEAGLPMDEVIQRTEWAVKNVRFFVYFETVDYLIRGGRLSKSKGMLAKALHSKPILTLDEAGRAQTVAKTFGGKSALQKVMQLVCKYAMGKRNLRFAVAHTNAPEKADWLAERLKREFEVQDVMIANASPALGAHAGPGAAGVAFLGE
ncbi:DegV family EDD domain-containing protein [candidate division KSB1 bacterium]|nr:DegV family EDD domain-containing protein [candidate division KSB1 bacterium]NIU25648.1 DegV family EDD domain-containing protein [candidate division KSB1 bacterium]NIU93305.1 DegV family EDD domain-containing protein [candidate division KSB1 bacterium]